MKRMEIMMNPKENIMMSPRMNIMMKATMSPTMTVMVTMKAMIIKRN